MVTVRASRIHGHGVIATALMLRGDVIGDIWDCRCGAETCRGRHQCDFFALPRQRQLEYLPFLDPWFARVHEQRLLALLHMRGLTL